jgi:tetratricopeptide (TPR) repeat protein
LHEKRRRSYALASGLFILALLTKTVTASLPAALLVIAWWRHGRIDWRRDVVPLLPWFVAAAAMGLLTAHFERELIGAKGSAFELGALERGLLAARVPWFYLSSLVWPLNLTFIYPRWVVDASVWWQWLFPLATFGALAAAAWQARRGQRAWLAAALLFGGTLFPVLGFVNVFPFLFSFVADHFQYLANLALFALAGAGVASACIRFGRGLALTGLAAALAACFALTWQQAGIYRDETTLWRATLDRNPDAWIAHNNLALLLANDSQAADAVAHLETALRLHPNFPEGLNNLADQYVNLGRHAEARALTERALVLLPKYPAALNTRGRALLALGDVETAVRSFEEALRLNPRFAVAWTNLGLAEMRRSRPAEALADFKRAADLRPEDAQAAFFVGATLVQLQRPAEAVPHLERALALDENHAQAHFQLALALRQLGRLAEANDHYRAAIELDPSLGR